MKLILSTVRGALRDRRGITALEYGMIAALITALLIPALILIGPKLATALNTLNAAIPAGS